MPSLSPGFKLWIQGVNCVEFDATHGHGTKVAKYEAGDYNTLPVSYFLMRNVTSPGVSAGDTGV
jgi:hypothetical protein